MNLLELRTKFVELSGRYDLATDTYADSGADFFLKAGQQHLDRYFGGDTGDQKSLARFFLKLAIGDIGGIFTDCRAIKEVWIQTTEGRFQLEKWAVQELREEYYAPYESTDYGTPLYYAPAVIRPATPGEAMTISSLDTIVAFGEIALVQEHRYNGIIIAPPPDEECVMEVWGLWYTPWPASDDGENFWMYRFPDILLLAGLYKLETLFHRNSEGARDYERALEKELIGIDKDVVEEQIAFVNQMEG